MPVRFYGGPLTAASEGFAAGSEGFARGMLAKKQMAQRQAEADRQYELELQRATQGAANDQERLALAKRGQDLEETQSKARLGMSERDQAMQEQAVGEQRSGSQALAQFGVTGNRMGPPDPEEEFAMDVARRMTTPAMAERFVNEYGKQKREKMILGQREKHLSQWQDFMRSPALGELPNRQEEIAARAKEAMDLLQSSEDPEQLAEVLKTSAKGLNDTRVSVAKDLDKAATYKRTVEFYAPQLAELQAASKGLPPDIAEEMQRRIAILSTAVSGVQAGILDPAQMQRLWYATMNQKMGGQGGAGKQQGGSKSYTYTDALRDARREFGDSAKIPAEQIRTRAEEFLKQHEDAQNQAAYQAKIDAQPEPDVSTRPGGGMPFSEGQGVSPSQPQAARAAPTTAVPFPQANGRRKFVDAIVEDLAKNKGQNLEALYQQFNIQPGSLPEEIKRQIKDRLAGEADKPNKARRDKLEHVGPNF